MKASGPLPSSDVPRSGGAVLLLAELTGSAARRMLAPRFKLSPAFARGFLFP
jgi:hypothetical protein